MARRGREAPQGRPQRVARARGPVVGTVYRADVEQYMEGIEILSVMPAKTASPLDPRHERLELIPVPRPGPTSW